MLSSEERAAVGAAQAEVDWRGGGDRRSRLEGESSEVRARCFCRLFAVDRIVGPFTRRRELPARLALVGLA